MVRESELCRVLVTSARESESGVEVDEERKERRGCGESPLATALEGEVEGEVMVQAEDVVWRCRGEGRGGTMAVVVLSTTADPSSPGSQPQPLAVRRWLPTGGRPPTKSIPFKCAIEIISIAICWVEMGGNADFEVLRCSSLIHGEVE